MGQQVQESWTCGLMCELLWKYSSFFSLNSILGDLSVIFPEDERGIRYVFSGLQDAAPSDPYTLSMGSETMPVPSLSSPSLQAPFLLNLAPVAENLDRLPTRVGQTHFSGYSCTISPAL